MIKRVKDKTYIVKEPKRDELIGLLCLVRR